jgi:hypothetical protein
MLRAKETALRIADLSIAKVFEVSQSMLHLKCPVGHTSGVHLRISSPILPLFLPMSDPSLS